MVPTMSYYITDRAAKVGGIETFRDEDCSVSEFGRGYLRIRGHGPDRYVAPENFTQFWSMALDRANEAVRRAAVKAESEAAGLRDLLAKWNRGVTPPCIFNEEG
jgi:hypothetical protein